MIRGSGPRPSRLVLLGHPVAHSLSPVFQAAALRRAGIDIPYEACDIAPGDLDTTLQQLVADGAAGNVTIPYKERVAVACARRTSVAERAGAVNTFWVDDGALIGDNTDVAAFHEAAVALLGGVPQQAHVGIIGAGGAAAAVLTAVERWPSSRVSVWGRSPERVAGLCARSPSIATSAATCADAVRTATLVVNATPVGVASDVALPFDVDLLAQDAAVLDLVYRPGETRCARLARARGHLAADGIGMLIAQGALAFERWFGIAPDRDVMWRAVRDLPASDVAH